ncbi:MAG: YraN family protein [Campylobacteraceae bacterium]
MDTNAFGKKAEKTAIKYLKKQGLEVLKENFYSRFGEIDIIAKDKTKLHFIEVKSTQNDYDPLFRITPSKLNKIIKTIEYYFLQNSENMDYQIDAIIVNNDKIEWIKNIDY